MKNLTSQKEKAALQEIVNSIEQLRLKSKSNEVLAELNIPLRIYEHGMKLATKILMWEARVETNEEMIDRVFAEMEEANLHYPIEAVFNIEKDICAIGYDREIWHPVEETLHEHYLNEVRRIVGEIEK